MENPTAATQVLASLRDGDVDDAIAAAVVRRDFHALAACVVYLSPGLTGLRHVRDIDQEGARLATDLLLLGITSDDSDFSSECWTIVEGHPEDFGLTADQAVQVHRLLDSESIDEAIDDTQQFHVLRWYHEHAGDAAIALARSVVDNHDLEDSDEYQRYALAIVGGTAETEDHQRLHALSGRLSDDGRTDLACTVLSAVIAPQVCDLEAVAAVIGALASNGNALPSELSDLLERFPTDLIPTLLQRSIETSDLSSWARSYLLSVLTGSHLPSLVAALAESWWPNWALDWLTAHVDWSDEHDELILSAITNLTKGERFDHAASVRASLREIITQSDGEDGRANYHPRLGATYLLNEALRGDIDSEDETLINALRHLVPSLRIDLYRSASWRRLERAKVAIEAIVCVDESDLTDHGLLEQIASLGSSARDAVLSNVAERLGEDEGSHLVQHLAHNPAAMTILAGVETTRPAVHTLWADSDDLLAFDALDATASSSGSGLSHLVLVEAKVRDYSNSLSAADRMRITRTLEVATRIKLLTRVIEDRDQSESRRPPRDVLMSTVDELGTIDDPEAVFAALREAGESFLDTTVRIRIVRALSQQRPTREIAEYLHQRQHEEVPALIPVVRECLDLVAASLDDAAGDEEDPNSESALAILVDVRPTLALPHARRRLFATDLGTRRAAVGVLGSNGGQEDIARLESVLDNEPQSSIREEIRAAIRLLKVGDLAAAHQELGQLSGLADPGWGSLDVGKMYGSFGPLLVSGLDRVMSNRHSGQFGQAIDQLSEVAKCLLFRSVEVAGSTITLKPAYIAQISSNAIDYGAVLADANLLRQWRWVNSFVSLYGLRTEHLASKGSLTPAAVRSQDDLTAAMVLFREGSKECLAAIRSAIAGQP